MTDDYADRRRAYVTEVRNSFEEESTEGTSYDESHQPAISALFSKIRLFAAVLLFGLFVAFKFTGISIGGYTAEDVIDQISDNHYYTKLKEYVTINEKEPWASWFSELDDTSEKK